jgi:hypothetical protein
MGHCCSTGRKPRRKASRVSAAKFRKGSAKLVIPVSGLNLTDATHLFELGSNVQLGGSVSAFVMEKDSRHMIAVGSKTNANSSPREAFSRTHSLGTVFHSSSDLLLVPFQCLAWVFSLLLRNSFMYM